MRDVDLVLAQAPTGVSVETATEALVMTCGDVAEAIKLLWDTAQPVCQGNAVKPPDFALDPSQRKWASVREVADSIFNSHL